MPLYENLEPTHLNNLPKLLGTGLRSTLINHASLLIQSGGLNIITDPHWGLRCSPVSWAGPKRVRSAGLSLSQLPRLDAILLSHNHYDHMDLGTLDTLLNASWSWLKKKKA